jgi:hypothetical protein
MMQRFRRTDEYARPHQIGSEAPLPGVIDTIGLGYASLALRPLVVLPPILLDLYLWLGMRITARPFTVEAATWVRDEGQDGASIAEDLQRFERFNILEFLSLRLPTFRMPTLVPNLTTARLDQVGITFEVSSLPWWLVVAAGIAAFALGLIIGAGWLVALACVTTGIGTLGDAIDPAVALRRSLSIVGWLAGTIGLFLLVSSPFIVGIIVGIVAGFDGIGLFFLLLFFPAAWGYMFFYFSIQATIVDRIGPFAAMRASYKVVRGYFWQSMRFIVLSLIITTGFPFALRAFTTNAMGLALAIVGNAFIASGMIAAAMLFYRDRARRLGLPAFAAER